MVKQAKSCKIIFFPLTLIFSLLENYFFLEHLNNFDLFTIMSVTYFIAGIIKGIIGIGLPTTGMAILCFFVNPITALGLNLIPMTISNLWQFYRADNRLQIIKDYKYFVISIIGFLLISSFFAAKIGNQLVSAIFGSMVLLFVITNSLSIKFEKIKVNDVKLQFVFGGLSGLIGGITSLWALPITIYLFIKDVSPKHFVDVSGFFILMGCFPVFLGYYSTDVLSNEMFKYGLMGALFSLIGFYIGEKIRGGIKKDLFKKLLLIFFTFIAIKMIFDAFFK